MKRSIIPGQLLHSSFQPTGWARLNSGIGYLSDLTPQTIFVCFTIWYALAEMSERCQGALSCILYHSPFFQEWPDPSIEGLSAWLPLACTWYEIFLRVAQWPSQSNHQFYLLQAVLFFETRSMEFYSAHSSNQRFCSFLWSKSQRLCRGLSERFLFRYSFSSLTLAFRPNVKSCSICG